MSSQVAFLAVDGGDRRLGLQRAPACAVRPPLARWLAGRAEEQAGVPAAAVLVTQRHWVAGGAEPGTGPGVLAGQQGLAEAPFSASSGRGLVQLGQPNGVRTERRSWVPVVDTNASL